MITIRKEIAINEGTAPFTYQWINNVPGCIVSFNTVTGTTSSLIETDITFTSTECLDTADISLAVVDANGCQGTYPITFINPCNSVAISSITGEIAGSQLTLTGIDNGGSYTYDWNYDNTIFDLVSDNGQTIILSLREDRPIATSTSIILTITAANGCSDTETYVHTFCTPVAEDTQATICIPGNNQTAAVRVTLEVRPCGSLDDINWSTLDLQTPTGVTWSFMDPNNPSESINIIIPSIPSEITYVIPWNVLDDQGVQASLGNVYLTCVFCANMNAMSSNYVTASPLHREFTCVEIAAFPSVYNIGVNVEDRIVTSEADIDWTTFTFIPGTGQSVAGTGTDSVLTTSQVRLSIDGNYDFIGDYYVGPTGCDIVKWHITSTNGVRSNIITDVLTYECNTVPVTVVDAFVMNPDPPFAFNDILVNDTGDIDPETVVITTPPTEGSTSVALDGTVQYSPASTTEGAVTFGYKVSDYNSQQSAEAIVTMTVITAGEDTDITECGTYAPVLFDEIPDPKTISGTWVRVSALGPAAPASYNSPITFTGEADGTYVYSYTVTSGAVNHTSIVTVEWTNDCCAGVTYIGTITGTSLADAGTSGTVRYTWSVGLGTLVTGTITLANATAIAGSPHVINIITEASSGEEVVTWTYADALWTEHATTITINLTNTSGCTCTGADSLSVPKTINIPSTVTTTITCV